MRNQLEMAISETFGSVLRVLLGTERRTFKLISIALQSMPALRLNQVCVLHNERGEPSGYALWAFVSDEVAAEMASNPDRILHYTEWNEGLNLWIVDFVAPSGNARALARKLADEVFTDFDRARGVRIRAGAARPKVFDVRRSRRAVTRPLAASG